MSIPSQYGKSYFGIQVSADSGDDVYVNADRLEVTPAGALVCWGHFYPLDEAARRSYGSVQAKYDAPAEAIRPEEAVLAFAPGAWRAYYAASVLDGRPVAVDHWPAMHYDASTVK